MSFRKMKWVYAVAGGGVVIGMLNYLHEQKRCVQTSWTTNYGQSPSTTWDYNWDRREFSKQPSKFSTSGAGDSAGNLTDDEKAPKPTAARHLVLVRHGQYNDEGKTDADRRLTPLGQTQAYLTGLRLKELNFNYTKMIHSTMTRAVETANIIHKNFPSLKIESCPLLCEGAPIPPEPPIGHWKPPAYEFFEDSARIEAAFRKYFYRADPSQKEDSFEIVVCHSNVIRYFICRVLQFPPEAWLRFSLYHASLTWITIRPSGRVYVSTIGDSGHIPKDKLTKV